MKHVNMLSSWRVNQDLAEARPFTLAATEHVCIMHAELHTDNLRIFSACPLFPQCLMYWFTIFFLITKTSFCSGQNHDRSKFPSVSESTCLRLQTCTDYMLYFLSSPNLSIRFFINRGKRTIEVYSDPQRCFQTKNKGFQR